MIQQPQAATLAVFDDMLKKTNFGADIISKNKVFLKGAINTATQMFDEIGIQYVKPDAGLYIMIDLEPFMKTSKYENE